MTPKASRILPTLSLLLSITPTVLTLILAFVFLHEDFTWKAALGSVLITAGTLVMVL